MRGARKGFASSERFDSKEYFAPERSYAPVYSWMWNDLVTEAETDERLAEMQRLGIKRFYILPIPKGFRPTSLRTEMSPEYLSEEYFAQYRYAVKRAKELGMEVWLYDEGGWPSGSACGQVLSESDDYAREYIRKESRPVSAGERYLPSEGTVAAFFGGSARPIEPGYIPREDVIVDEYRRVIARYQGTSDFPDLTKENATDAFLRLTHEKYAAALGDELGDTITAVFTDEPTGPRPFPYRKELSDAFFARYNVRIEDYFPQLFGVVPLTEESARIKVDWYEFCSGYFCKNYLEKEKKWTNDHKMVFLGHMDKDDESDASVRGGSYHIMRALRLLDVPGVDAIHRQIYPNKAKVEAAQKARKDGRFTVGKANGFFPRYASSAAAQTGGRHALTESFAVYGNGLTFAEMRYVLNFQAVRGVNVFNLMMLSYGKQGYLRTGELPHFDETHACFGDLAAFNLYCERLSYLASLGERAADVALYYPIRDSLAGEGYKETASLYEAVGEALEAAHVDFDVFDDDVILGAEETLLSKGIVHLGRANYGTLVIPKCRYISAKAKERLARFVKGGGRILTVGDGEGSLSIDGALDCTISDLAKYIASPIEFIGDAVGIDVSHVVTENGGHGDLYLIFNGNEEAKTFSLVRPKGQVFLLDDIAAGSVRILPEGDETMTLTLASGELICLLKTNEDVEASPLFSLENGRKQEGWTFRRTERFRIRAEDFAVEEIRERSAPIELGDWRARVGEDYSGSGVYETTFAWRGEHDCVIDFGEVKYSCELVVNGVNFGKKVMPPYRYNIPASCLRGENTLSLRVSNSCANEFHYTRAFDHCDAAQLTSYIEIENEYLPDSLSGGLFGDVILYECRPR